MNLDVAALELACLHRQVTTRQACPHRPAHEPAGDVFVRRFAAASPRDVQARIRRSCQPVQKP